VVLIEQINHKQIPVYASKTPDGHTFTHFGEYGEMLERLKRYHRHALLTAAAAIYNRTGSLELVASALCWTSFQAPSGESEEALQEWVEDNRDQIPDLAYSSPALAVAHGQMYKSDG
jgi:hypothetical protein